MEEPYVAVSCHVELPLDDRCWEAFARFQARQPAGFRITCLMRPPDPGAAEDEEVWLERARQAARHGPLGHHTHFGGRDQARPKGGGPPADRVRREVEWLRGHGLEPRLFCGGAWYMDAQVAAVLAEHGYADCTATAFRPRYLVADAPRVALAEPAWLGVAGRRLLELPSTHSIGMALRAAFRPLPRHVHVYFHDRDLLSAPRRTALEVALRVLGRRRRPVDLEALRLSGADAELELSSVCAP